MQELSQRREQALVDQGRVELGGSVLPALIDGFCDSPYLLQEEYAATLAELVAHLVNLELLEDFGDDRLGPLRPGHAPRVEVAVPEPFLLLLGLGLPNALVQHLSPPDHNMTTPLPASRVSPINERGPPCLEEPLW